MSGSRWVITPSSLSGSLRSLCVCVCVCVCVCSSFLYSYHLFLVSSASVMSIPFLSFTEPIFAWNVPLVSLIFLKRSLVFRILLFSSISLHNHWGRLSYLLAILWNSAFRWVYLSFSPLLFASLLFTAICVQGLAFQAAMKLCLLHCVHCRDGSEWAVLCWTAPFAHPETLASILQLFNHKSLICVILPSGSHCIWTMGWTTEAEAKWVPGVIPPLTVCGIMLASLHLSPEDFSLSLCLSAFW